MQLYWQALLIGKFVVDKFHELANFSIPSIMANSALLPGKYRILFNLNALEDCKLNQIITYLRET